MKRRTNSLPGPRGLFSFYRLIAALLVAPLVMAGSGTFAAAPPSANAGAETRLPFPAGQTLDATKTEWHGFPRYDFLVGGRKCLVVSPREVAVGRPWIWRARFFGHEPQADIQLLERGFHVGYCDVSNLFGNPDAVAHGNAFYQFLTKEHGFSRRVALEGMSRGGLMIYHWAAANPDKVACIYGDAPVCDFKSWPGGKGRGKGSQAAWRMCLDAYGLTEEQALAYRKNPIDQLAHLAKADIPLLHVVGQADDVVPVEENTDILADRYRRMGGTIAVIRKPGVGHHPHSLKDPTPIVEFVLKHTTRQHRSDK